MRWCFRSQGASYPGAVSPIKSYVFLVSFLFILKVLPILIVRWDAKPSRRVLCFYTLGKTEPGGNVES